MVDLFQDLAKVKILLLSTYEEFRKAGKLSEEQLEAIIHLIDSIETDPEPVLQAELERIFANGRGDG